MLGASVLNVKKFANFDGPECVWRHRDEHVVLAEAEVGVALGRLLDHPGRDHEEVHGDERDLAVAALEDDRAWRSAACGRPRRCGRARV